jgi:peroxiredoxin
MECIFLVFFSSACLAEERGESLDRGNPLPAFKLQNLDGRYVTYDDIGKGKILYLSFWATWCRPCVKELHEAAKIYGKYSEKGFEVVAVSIDDVKTKSRVKPFVKSQRFTFPVLLDPEKKYYKKFHSPSPPYSLLVGRDGTIVRTHHGFLPGDEVKLEEDILRLIEIENCAQDEKR